jgi:hypothetical protein
MHIILYTVNKNFGFKLPKRTVSKIQLKFQVFTPKFRSFFNRSFGQKNTLKCLSTRSFNNPGYLAIETLSSTKIYEIPIESSEERKPGN